MANTRSDIYYSKKRNFLRKLPWKFNIMEQQLRWFWYSTKIEPVDCLVRSKVRIEMVLKMETRIRNGRHISLFNISFEKEISNMTFTILIFISTAISSLFFSGYGIPSNSTVVNVFFNKVIGWCLCDAKQREDGLHSSILRDDELGIVLLHSFGSAGSHLCWQRTRRLLQLRWQMNNFVFSLLATPADLGSYSGLSVTPLWLMLLLSLPKK